MMFRASVVRAVAFPASALLRAAGVLSAAIFRGFRLGPFAVGDSFSADVKPFMDLGTRGVWLKRHGALEAGAVRSLKDLEPLL